MNKRTRFVILIGVLAICFAFLWPSVSWYWGTPKDVQTLALGSLEQIRDYAESKASEDVRNLEVIVRAAPDEVLPEEYSWLEKKAVKQYKKYKREVPAKLTAAAVLNAYDSEMEFREVFLARYRDSILKAKNRYVNSVKLGLDLSGGMNIVVKADLDAALESQKASGVVTNEEQFKKDIMTQAIENLSSRIDKFGLTEPVIRLQGEDRIYIEMPGAAESDTINTIIMGKGVLNFRLVDSEASSKFNDFYNRNPASTFDVNGNLINPSLVPDDCELFGTYTKDAYGLDERTGYLVVKKEIALEGKHIKSAEVGADHLTNQPQVNFVLDSEGAQIFADFTGAHVGESLAIVSDNKIKSNARINSAITGGQVAITGFGLEEAKNLQKVLQSAWLNVPLSVESQQVVGASLGDQAIRQGIKAIAVGLSLIMIFMLVWYKGAGWNAIVAQVLNLYIMFSILSAFNLTLSLSSIAGMILTIGMAVDANVIIFERIKEELALGKSRATAISAGFDNAFWAIMDSNITTFIAAIFLSMMGSGTIQGFAVSLSIGVISSVFTALFVSRLMFDFNTEVMKKQKVSISWRIK